MRPLRGNRWRLTGERGPTGSAAELRRRLIGRELWNFPRQRGQSLEVPFLPTPTRFSVFDPFRQIVTPIIRPKAELWIFGRFFVVVVAGHRCRSVSRRELIFSTTTAPGEQPLPPSAPQPAAPAGPFGQADPTASRRSHHFPDRRLSSVERTHPSPSAPALRSFARAWDSRPCLKTRRAAAGRNCPVCLVLAPQRLFRLSRLVSGAIASRAFLPGREERRVFRQGLVPLHAVGMLGKCSKESSRNPK